MSFIDSQLEPAAAVDSASDVHARDTVGHKSDSHGNESNAGRLHMLDEHFHHSQFVFPHLAAAVTLTANVTPWVFGDWVEIIAANAVNEDYDLHWATVPSMNNNGQYQIELGYGFDDTHFTYDAASRTTNQTRGADSHVQGPIIPANSRLRARVASSVGGATLDLKVKGHKY